MMNNYSVLMSVYYKEKAFYFSQAIESMLKQTVPPSDFVIVCDGPLNEELEQIINIYTQLYPQLFTIIRMPENKGLGIALQIGVDACKCDIIARMDTDDISVPNRMERQLEYLNANENVSAVGGQIAEFNEDITNIISYRKVDTTPLQINQRVKFQNPMNHMTVTFKKKDVIEAGNYQSFLYFEDYHLWARMIKGRKQMANLDEICCYVRIDDDTFKRRGGPSYFKRILAMENYLLSLKVISHIEYLRNLIIRFVGNVLISNNLRSSLYKKFMRK